MSDTDTEVLAAAILLIAPQVCRCTCAACCASRRYRVEVPVRLARAALHLGLPIPPDLRREALCADDTSVLPLEDAAELWLLDPAARQIVNGIGRPDPGKPSTDVERARVAGLAQCDFGTARRYAAAFDEGVPIPSYWEWEAHRSSRSLSRSLTRRQALDKFLAAAARATNQRRPR